MKTHTISAIALCTASILVTVMAPAQTLVAPFRSATNGLWGYIDDGGVEIIPAQFGTFYPFNESGWARVEGDTMKRLMFINLQGEFIRTSEKPDIYLFARVMDLSFNCGLAPFLDGLSNSVRTDTDTWGFVDMSGKVVIPDDYGWVSPFYDSVAIARHHRVLDFYLLSTDGTRTTIAIEKVTSMRVFSSGLAAFEVRFKRWGFMNSNGEVVIPATFKEVGHFRGEVAWARDEKNMIVYIDKTGAVVIPPRFEAGFDIDPVSGWARVNDRGEWIYAGRDGATLRVPGPEKLFDFHEGFAVARVGKLVGVIDHTGAWVVPPRFEMIRDVHNGLAAVRVGDLWGFIDTKGEWVIQPKYKDVGEFVLVP